MIVADVEIRNCETNETVIDLSLEDDVPGTFHDVEKQSHNDRPQVVRYY